MSWSTGFRTIRTRGRRFELGKTTEFHASGFPMIRARTIKGLLRESAQDILEITGENVSLDDLFGISDRGELNTQLRISNAYIQNWDKIKNELTHFNAYTEKIKEYYSEEIQQTSIEESGIAKDASLRNYRLVKSNNIFEALIEFDKENLEFLNKVCLNLRYAGTRRNRGWGRISVSITESDLDNVIESTTNKILDTSTRIGVKIKTIDPVILGSQLGDQNTVNSQLEISGNHLRGIIIQEYLNNSGRIDDDFLEFFFSGKIKFNSLSLKNSEALPLHYHYEKSDQDKVVLNVFELEKAKITKITKPIGQKYILNSNEYEVCTPRSTANFHNSRKDNRAAGRSTKDMNEGGIFYYEALDANQVFEGSIEGDMKLLNKLANLLPTKLSTQIGKSRSTQYGTIELELMPLETSNVNFNLNSENEYLLHLLSPTILINQNGLNTCDEFTLIEELKPILGNITIVHRAVAFSKLEQYNQIWKNKSGKHDVLKEGSGWVIKLDENRGDIPNTFYIGAHNVQGFGRLKISEYKNGEDNIPTISSILDSNLSANPTSLDILNTDFSSLKKYIEDEEVKETLKKTALEKMSIFNQLNNHQLSRLINAFETKTTRDEIQKFCDELKGKSAHNQLTKARFLDPDGKFNWHIISETKPDWEIEKEAYLLLLRTMRKNN